MEPVCLSGTEEKQVETDRIAARVIAEYSRLVTSAESTRGRAQVVARLQYDELTEDELMRAVKNFALDLPAEQDPLYRMRAAKFFSSAEIDTLKAYADPQWKPAPKTEQRAKEADSW
jgi:hypothetical protein